MKSKFFISSILLSLALIFTLGIGAYGQGIGWLPHPGGVELSNLTPGDTTTVTLKFVITDGMDLTKDQWLNVDLSSFQINSTQAIVEGNYTFSTTTIEGETAIDMDNDGTDFEATVSGSVVTFTLLNENSIVPADTITLVIDSQNGLLKNKGKGPFPTGFDDDIQVKVRSQDQPVNSTDADTDDILDKAQNSSIITFTLADTNASEQTYFTLVDSERADTC